MTIIFITNSVADTWQYDGSEYTVQEVDIWLAEEVVDEQLAQIEQFCLAW